MSLLDALEDAQRRADWLVAHAKAPTTEGALLASSGYSNAGVLTGMNRQANTSQHAEQYRHFTGQVYTSIRPIAQRIAGQTVRVARVLRRPNPADRSVLRPVRGMVPKSFAHLGAKLEILDNHPILDAIARPNTIMVRWGLLYVTVVSLEMTGKAFWWLDNSKGVWEIWPVPSSWMEPVHTPERLYAQWKIKPEAGIEPTTVDGRVIVYFSYPRADDPFGVVAPLQTQAREVAADEAQREAQRRAYLNGTNPGTILTIGRHPDVANVPGQRPILTPRQRQEIIQRFKEYYRGVYHNDEPLIEDGQLESVRPFSRTPKEMDFLNSGKVTRSRISQGFGTNPIIVGEIEGANRASAASADQHFADSTVNPKIELLSEIMTVSMGPLFSRPGEILYVYLEPARAYDPDLEIAEENALAAHVAITVNEIRQRHGLPPVKGGDVVYAANTLIPIDLNQPPQSTADAIAAAPQGGGGKSARPFRLGRPYRWA